MSYQGLPQNEGDVLSPNPPHSEFESKNPLVYSTETSPSPGPGQRPALYPRPESYGGRPGSRVSMAIGADFRHRYGDIAPPQWGDDDYEDSGRGLQTQYDPLKAGLMNQLARKHSKKHQFWHLLGKVMLRLAATVALSAAMVGLFYYFQNVKIITSLELSVFNLASTGIYLTMGLNMAGAFKGMATMLRWKILSRKSHNLKEVDMILGLNSLIKVYKLGIEALGFRKPGTFFLCWLWILINLIARVSIALTGLTYSYDSAGGIATIPGQAFVSDKTAFWPLGFKENKMPARGAQYQTAHVYGQASSILVDTDHPTAKEHERILAWNQATESWEYTFRTWNNTMHSLEALTNRTVSVNATCTVHDIIDGQDGTMKDITFRNSTDNEEYIFPNITVRGAGATVWANPNHVLLPEQRPACQDYLRCAVVYGFQYINPDETGFGKLFECYVNVGKISNAYGPADELSDEVAWTAAGAIGLDGFTDDVDEWLYQRYFLGTQFGQRIDSKDPKEIPKLMARQVSRFAAGVIAILDSDNPPVEVFGDKPWAGVLFKVKWLNLGLILGGITIAQALLGLAAVIWANTVFVKDDSYLSTARLLRPLVERLGSSGCALTGEEIASTLKTMMVYGVRVDSKAQRHHLDIGEDIRPVSKFPAGWYDGETGEMRVYRDDMIEEEEEVEEVEERVLERDDEMEETMLLLA